MVNYIPKQKDIVFVNLNLIKGHEQSGYRLALVISSDIFNKFTKMVMVCPITSNIKEFPTYYILKNTNEIKDSVLLEHIRSIDYEVRNFKFIENLNDGEFEEIVNLFNSCIEG